MSLQADLLTLLPELILAVGGMALLLAGAIGGEKAAPAIGWGAILLLALAGAAVVLGPGGAAFGGAFIADGFSRFAKLLILAGAGLSILLAEEFFAAIRLSRFELPVLMVIATLGMLLMVSAGNFLALYMGLELQSLALYVLAAFNRDHLRSTEAGLKYFVLGALSSGMLLYGISLLYGFTGSTAFTAVAATIHAGGVSLGVIFGLVFLIAGLAFKVSAVPFHMWTPDAYEGAPTVVTAFMSTAVKAAAFAAFARVFLSTLEPLQGHWMPVLSWIAAATMIGGSVLGVLQSNIKRMLAYSSIAHAGYLLLGIVAANSAGKAAILFYLLAYAVANLGALGIVALLGTRDHAHDQLRDFAGLWTSRPGLAGLMTVFLLSLGGFPPTAGFIGKWYIFNAAVQDGHYWLAIIGVLTSVVSVFFYLRIVVMMYMTDEAVPARPRVSMPSMLALGFAMLATFYLGVLPTKVLDYALQSIQTIF
jgi:NADH-quinone oxidoreductase subunit N